MKAIEIKAPNKIIDKPYYKKVFLAGSIESDPNSPTGSKAEEWQKNVIKHLNNELIIFLNPRRDNWDASWKQEITNKKFREQVEWELIGLEESDLIVMVFDPKTKSPISLLELGLHASNPEKLIVLCPNGFWRKGNVDIVCHRYGIFQVTSFKQLISEIKKRVNE